MLPLPSLHTGSKYKSCCGKLICSGCIHAVAIRDRKERKCPFCRVPSPTSEAEIMKRTNKRVDLGDANAMCNLGCDYSTGLGDLPQNHAKALELYNRAGERGRVL
jgi:hypothetical protein